MQPKFRRLLLKTLSEKLDSFTGLSGAKPPGAGWLRSIRLAFGMPLHYAARKLNMTSPGFAKLEKAEASGAISLKTLERAADALDCDLVYALLPRDGTLLNQFRNRARRQARRIMEPVGQSMLLEAQSAGDLNERIEQLADEIVASPHPKLWTEE